MASFSGFGSSSAGGFGSSGGFGTSTTYGGGFGTTNAGTGGGFGATQQVGASSGFGTSSSNPPSSGGFGSTSTVGGFGTLSNTGGFGSAATTTGGFGSAATTTAFGSANTTGGFGSTSTVGGGFGASATTTGGFGASAGGGFGGTSNTGGFGGTGFGAAPNTGGFGAAPTSGFGAVPSSTGFGATSNTGFSNGLMNSNQVGFGAFGGAQASIGYRRADIGTELIPSPGQVLIYALCWSPNSTRVTVIGHNANVRSYEISETVTGINQSGIAEKDINSKIMPEITIDQSLGIPTSGIYLDDNTICVGTQSGKCVLYNVENGTGGSDFPQQPASNAPIASLVLLSHDVLVTGSMDGVIVVWKYQGGSMTEMTKLSMQPVSLRSLIAVPCTRMPNLLALGSDCNIHVLTLSNGIIAHSNSIRPHNSMRFPLECISLDPRTLQLFIGSMGGRGCVMKLEENTMNGSLALSPHANQHYAFTCHRHLNGKEVVRIFSVHDSAFTSKNRLITCGGDGTIVGWDIGMKKTMWRLNDGKPLPLAIQKFSISPNEQYICYGCSEEPLNLIAKGPSNALFSRVLIAPTPQTLLS